MPDITVAGADNPYAGLRAPGEIQGFGAMLTLHPATMRVLNASVNVGSELGVPHPGILGRPLADLIDDPACMAEIRDGLAGDGAPSFANPLPVTIGGQRFDLVMHGHDGLVIAEFERLAPGAPVRGDMDRLSDDAIMGMMVPSSMAELLETGPRAIREATGFDRVLLYRFDDAYRGQVVGEARRPGVESFMGLFFPESDIGAPARTLYTQNFCRYIPQIGGATSRVEPSHNPLNNAALDMSHAVLRAVAPCHVEYLRNMGVAASMSFSIVSEGRLWGLFACHHYSAAQLSYTQRLVCEQIAMMFAAKLVDLVHPDAVREDLAERQRRALETLPLGDGNPLHHDWSAEQEQTLLSLVNAEGAAIYIEGEVGEIGTCPDLAELHRYIDDNPEEFGRLLQMYDDAGLFYSSSISSTLPCGVRMREKGSGMMVVPLSRTRREYLLWFRPELVVKATWAGDPSVTKIKDLDAKFSPRRSFAAWKADIRDMSEPWTKLEIENATALRDRVLSRIGQSASD